VEDNPSDLELTLRALKKNNVTNHIQTVHDGARRWITFSAAGGSRIALPLQCQK